MKKFTCSMAFLIIFTLSAGAAVQSAFAGELPKTAASSPDYTGNNISLAGIGLTEDIRYVFSDGELDMPPEGVLLMLNGSFTAKATAVFANEEYADLRYYVPLRAVAESFGASVEWSGADKSITIIDENNIIIIQIGETRAEINHNGVTLKAPPVIKNGRAYIYFGFIQEILNKDIAYIPDFEYPAIAANTVVWIDEKGTSRAADSSSAELLDYLKSELSIGLAYMIESCKGDEFEEQVLAAVPEIEKAIMETIYKGPVGRYALFSGPYTILVDSLTRDIYFYLHGNAYGGIYKEEMNDPRLFWSGYISG